MDLSTPQQTPIVVGIDPGATGGIALIQGNTLLEVTEMPAENCRVGRVTRLRVFPAGVVRLLSHIDQSYAVWLEQVNGGPRDGGGSAFVFGRCVGILETALAVRGIEPEWVVPQVWKRALGLSGKDKAASVERAEVLFPNHKGRFRGPRGGGRDGLAEAALIAWYGAQKSR